MQLHTDPGMRGRVMALYMMIFMGGTPLGAPVIGWVGETFGARWTLILGGAADHRRRRAALVLLRSLRCRRAGAGAGRGRAERRVGRRAARRGVLTRRWRAE